jgi:predicted RecA/RadA family phage recombinase
MSVKIRDHMDKIRTMKYTHTSATTKDVIYLLGGRVMLALETALANAANMFLVTGLINYTKVSTEVWVVGQTVYWDNANSRFTNVNGVGVVRAGVAAEAAANPSTTGYILLDLEAADMVPEIQRLASVATITTAGVATYTAAQLLGKLIKRDPAGSARSDVTPTAAQIVAAIPNARVGDCFEFTIRNDADAAETITVTAGTGVTLSGTMTVAQNNSKKFLAVLDNVTSGAEAVTIYSLGTFVH